MNNNPLKQYFRRPALYFRLPSGGKGYKPNAINIPESGELAVYPMTAIDEITSKTPDALFNGTVVTELIKSCVPDIKDPWSITNIDLDAILLAMRSASVGNELELESICPKCEDVGKYGANLMAILSQLRPGDYTQTLSINDLVIKFKPLSYKEINDAAIVQFEIQRAFALLSNDEENETKLAKTQELVKRITLTTMEVVSSAIEYVQTPNAVVEEKSFILDFLKNCDKDVYISIRDYHNKLKEGTEVKPLKIKCIHCSHEYDQAFTLNPSDFFG